MFERKETARSLKDRAADWLRAHRHGLIEHGKTLLILVLFCSACFFADRSGILGQGGLSDLGGRLTAWMERDEGTSLPGSRSYAAAARPQAMMVSPEDGVHHGAAFHSETDELYDRFAAFLGEALGTAGEMEPITAEQWRAALPGRGVYFDFGTAQSLECLAAWQQTNLPWNGADSYARRLFLSAEGQDVRLYFVVEGSGMAYCCDTAVEVSALSVRLDRYQSNGAYFVLEQTDPGGSESTLAPETLIVPAADQVRSVSASAGVLNQPAAGVLRLFGMNDITATSYLETNGMTVYLDGDSTLRVNGDGVILFEREAGGAEPESDLRGAAGMPDVADSLYRMLLELTGEEGECARLRLVKAEYASRLDRYTVEFSYVIDGMQVCYAPGPAAEFTVTGGVLTQARVRLRQYQFTGETQTPLPPLQAAALVEASGGSDPVRVYQDQGDRVTVSWRMG